MLARLRKRYEDGSDEGFTLIELLVVMVIVGILAAIAIPTFLNQKSKSYDTASKSAIRTVALAEEAFNTNSATGYTTTYASLNLAATDKSATTFVKMVGADTQGFCLEAFDSRKSGATLYYWDSQAGGFSTVASANCTAQTAGAATPWVALPSYTAGTTTAPSGWN